MRLLCWFYSMIALAFRLDQPLVGLIVEQGLKVQVIVKLAVTNPLGQSIPKQTHGAFLISQNRSDSCSIIGIPAKEIGLFPRCDEYPLLIMMEYYRRPGGDVKKSSGRPRRGSDLNWNEYWFNGDLYGRQR